MTSKKKLQAENDRLHAEVDRLNNLITDKTIPALIASAHASGRAVEFIEQAQQQRDIDDAIRRRRDEDD